MAGSSLTIQRIWSKTLDSVNRATIDPLKAFFDSLNALVVDVETLRVARSGVVFSSAGLVIKAASNTLAKAGSAFRFINSAGKFGLVAANTDMAALSGTVTNAKFNVFVFSATFDGTTFTPVTRIGTEAATRGAVVFPTVPATDVLIGFVEINPTGTGNFVGGTTALDDATVVPNATYVNFVGVPNLGATAVATGLTGFALAEKNVA
jgi:hypothetical protein